tara:strand:- start:1622 stop:2197 length:576 start_codon:yes stop_codon:yes gene_type:complete
MGKSKTMKHKKIYSLNDYNSGDGMLTSVWGPSMWHSMHTISFNYPVNPTKNDKRNYRDYILNIKYVLPCGKCRNNLNNNFKKLPLRMKHMENRETFSKYVYELHELINTMLGKKSGLSYDDVRERYEDFRARCTISLNEVKNRSKTYKKKENGCTEPLYGEKSKCILKIIPNDNKEETFQIHEKCVRKILE